MNNPASDNSLSAAGIPRPVPALSRFSRMAEAGIDTRQYIGLDRNERISPFPEWFMDKVRESVTSSLLNWYPSQDQLHLQIQKMTGLPQERIVITPSSDAAFKAIYQAYLRPGDKVVMLDPSYAMFPVYADMFEAEAVLIPYNQNLELDTRFLLDSIVPGVRLLMIANPNQPTGTIIKDALLIEVIEKAYAVGALVAVDEAYYPFGGTTAMPWIEKYPNLMVTRTFSKAAGLAGLRIGFVAGHSEVITNLDKVRTVNDLNSFSILCASEILNHPEIVDDYVAEVHAGEQTVIEMVEPLGLAVLPTNTNFVLIRVADKCEPGRLVEAMKERGYLIKGPMDAACVADCVRIALGPPHMMADFSLSLKEALESQR